MCTEVRNEKIFLSGLTVLPLIFALFAGVSSANTNDVGSENTKLDYYATKQAQGSSGDKVSIYKDKVDNKYIFNNKGEQVGFIKSNVNSKTYSDYKIDMNDAVRIADDVLTNTIKANCSRNYIMTDAAFIDDMNIFSITYHYIIDDFQTSDFVFVTLSCNGEILSYAAPNIGAFDGVNIPPIDKSEIRQMVVNHIIQTYDCIDYSIENMILVKNAGLTLSVSYSVTLSDETYVADSYCIDLV